MQHGGDLALAIDRYGGTEADWLDLSTGINPHAWPVPEPLAAGAWRHLPGQNQLDRLLGAARRAYGCPEHLGLVAAPGTQALIAHLPELLGEGDAAIVAPTYSSHGAAWARAGRKPLDVGYLEAIPDTARFAVVVNPNNPDGRLTSRQSQLTAARTLSERGGYLIVDEAFADVVPGASLLPAIGDENILVLRSFGKFFGLAGLRLGFLAGPRRMTRVIMERLDSWAVSGPALDIGRTALADTAWQEAMRLRLADEMADLTLMLSEEGLTVFGGTPLFALAATRNAAGLHDALARRRIWTRVFDYAPTWMRIGLPGSAENRERLRQALAEALKEH